MKGTICFNNLRTFKDPLVFLDVETTGLSPNKGHRICEIAMIKLRNGCQTDSFESLVNPLRSIPAESSRINGITQAMLDGAPFFSDISCSIREFIKDCVIVCHNAEFDLSFLNREMVRANMDETENPCIDTLLIARRYFSFHSNALNRLSYLLGIEHDSAHRAMSDTKATVNLLEYMLGEMRKFQSIADIRKIIKTRV